MLQLPEVDRIRITSLVDNSVDLLCGNALRAEQPLSFTRVPEILE